MNITIPTPQELGLESPPPAASETRDQAAERITGVALAELIAQVKEAKCPVPLGEMERFVERYGVGGRELVGADYQLLVATAERFGWKIERGWFAPKDWPLGDRRSVTMRGDDVPPIAPRRKE